MSDDNVKPEFTFADDGNGYRIDIKGTVWHQDHSAWVSMVRGDGKRLYIQDMTPRDGVIVHGLVQRWEAWKTTGNVAVISPDGTKRLEQAFKEGLLEALEKGPGHPLPEANCDGHAFYRGSDDDEQFAKRIKETLQGIANSEPDAIEPNELLNESKLVRRYQECVSKLWNLFDQDPLGDSHAHFYIERLEEMVEKRLLVPANTTQLLPETNCDGHVFENPEQPWNELDGMSITELGSVFFIGMQSSCVSYTDYPKSTTRGYYGTELTDRGKATHDELVRRWEARHKKSDLERVREAVQLPEECNWRIGKTGRLCVYDSRNEFELLECSEAEAASHQLLARAMRRDAEIHEALAKAFKVLREAQKGNGTPE